MKARISRGETGRNAGARKTRQRGAIRDVLEASPGPLTVGEILERSRRRVPRLGPATVYRTINGLVAGGVLREVHLPHNDLRYEVIRDAHHCHFQCSACRRVFDLRFCPVVLPADMDLPPGFIVDGHSVVLYGTCAECADEASQRRRRKPPRH